MTDTLIRITAGESANFTYMVATATQTRCCLYTNLIPLTSKYSAVRHVLLNQRHLVTTFGLYFKSSLLSDFSMTVIPGLNQYLYYYITNSISWIWPLLWIYNDLFKNSSKNACHINSTIISTCEKKCGNVRYNVRSIAVFEGRTYTIFVERWTLWIDVCWTENWLNVRIFW